MMGHASQPEPLRSIQHHVDLSAHQSRFDFDWPFGDTLVRDHVLGCIRWWLVAGAQASGTAAIWLEAGLGADAPPEPRSRAMNVSNICGVNVTASTSSP